MKVLMLKLGENESLAVRGDTLIEVTVALAILSMVLMGSAAVATVAFRMGQTARERTTLVEAAQEQMEALHNFRDNHTWQEFLVGNNCGGVGGFCGVNQAGTDPAHPCQTTGMAGDCFYMQKFPAGAPTGWVPVAGTLSEASPDPHSTQLIVPTSIVEIAISPETKTAPSTQGCDYDVELHYSFLPLGETQMAYNQIKTRFANLKYNGGAAGCLP